MKLILKPNEMILRAGDTNLLLNDHQVPGKLIVTNQRIYFISLRDDYRHYDKEITPEEIRELIYFKTNWLFPYGMKIITRNGDEHPFVVRKRDEWSKLITRMF
jgi:hypothetical protein